MKPIDRDAAVILRDAPALAAWLARVAERGVLALAVETTAADEMRAEPVGIGLCIGPRQAAYLPIAHVSGSGGLFDEPVPGQVPLAEALALLKPVLEDPAILKAGQNVKAAVKLLARHGVALAPIDDTMLISYALHAGQHGHGLDYLSESYLGHVPLALKSLTGGGKAALSFAQLPVEEAARIAAERAEVVWRLREALKPRLPFARVTRVYETMERPLVPVLAAMEANGVRVDRARLSRLSGDFAQRMAALESEIHGLAGGAFNVGSPKQLGEVLFDQMGLGGGKKGKTGAYSTGADVLEELAAQGHDLPARVLDWRMLSKLKSTYTDTLQDAINPETGRVHTSYQIAGAATGRLASIDPNLQNIPVRTDEGRRIREAFVAEPGNVLLSLDYSQIELRILAHMADIEALRQAFRDGLDIHAMTASEMFGVPIEGMPAHVRRQAKAINFGVIYGISAFGLANNLRIPRGDAQRFIDTYFERFPGIREYMNRTIAFAREHGHVETLFGRRIHVPEINARGPHVAAAQRQAINAPIQGSAADILRRAMIRVPAAIDAPARPDAAAGPRRAALRGRGRRRRRDRRRRRRRHGRSRAPRHRPRRAAGRRRRPRRQLGRGALSRDGPQLACLSPACWCAGAFCSISAVRACACRRCAAEAAALSMPRRLSESTIAVMPARRTSAPTCAATARRSSSVQSGQAPA